MAATGKNIADVAKDHNYSKHTFYRVINGVYCNQKVQNIIAELIKKPTNEIWPDSNEEKSA